MSITPPPSPSTHPQRLSVLILGGSGLIGRAVCQQFGKEHWKVGIHYYDNHYHAEQTAEKIKQLDEAVFIERADVRQFQEVNRLVQSFTSQSGQLDVLVCAFGIGPTNMLVRTTPESWTHTISVNLTGTFHALRSVGPIFQRQQHGSVIVVGVIIEHVGFIRTDCLHSLKSRNNRLNEDSGSGVGKV